LRVGQRQIDEDYIGTPILQMAFGLVKLMRAAQAKLGSAARAEHAHQAPCVDRIPFDQKYLNRFAGHSTPHLWELPISLQ
jgi:hypothetical protein